MHARVDRAASGVALLSVAILFAVLAVVSGRAASADGRPVGPQEPVALVAPVPGPTAKITPPPPPPPPPPLAAPARAAPAASRGAEWASGLAQRLGLKYEDGGAFVLLSDAACRVRIYPNTHVISLDGRDEVLRGTMKREMQGVLVPGPAAGIIEAHVLGSRVVRILKVEPVVMPRAPVAPPVAPAPAGASTVKPKAAAPARTGAVAPDPAWVVAPTGRTWTWIILHHSDDLTGCLSKYHQGHLDKGWEHGCGYHFVIGNGTQSGDGEVEVGPRWRGQLQGAHAKTPDNEFNDHGIGICLVGDFENGSGRPTAAQLRSLQRLAQWLLDRYDIPLANLRGHCHCKPTCCPGRNFPWAEVRAGLRDPRRTALAAALTPPASAPAKLPPSPLAQRSAPSAAHAGPRSEVPVGTVAAAQLAPGRDARTGGTPDAALTSLGSPPAGHAPVALPAATLPEGTTRTR